MKNIKILRIFVFFVIFLLGGTFSRYLEHKAINITPRILVFSIIASILESIFHHLLKKADK